MATSPEELQAQLKAAQDAWDTFTTDIGNFKLTDLTSKFNSFATEAIRSIKSVSASMAQMQDGTSKMGESLTKVAGGLSQIVTLATRFDAFKNLTVQGGASASTMADQFDLLLIRFGSFDKAAKELANGATPALASALAKGQEATRAFFEHAASAEHLEQVYLSLQGATGNLGKSFGAMGLKNLDDDIGRFATMLSDAAAQSNKTLGEVSKLATGLGTIPGALTQMIRTGEGSDQQMTALIGTLRLAAGAQRDVNEVVKVMETAYEKLGNAQGPVNDNVDKGARMFGLMSEASQKLNLRFSDTEGFLNRVAENFKNIGDNTQGATNILARFTGALQNTGLTAKASVDLVSGMVDAMKKLEVGTKALISARTGGPGGLQGAFQIDNLIRGGKIDQVSKMLEQTLRQQFNGKIYTQAEAGQSQQAASQFLRQRTMIQSGAFGSLAPDAESATRLLEALKQGPAATGAVIKDSISAVKETTNRGNDIQQRQYTVLNKVNAGMDKLVSLNEMRFKIDARNAIGTTKEGDFSTALKDYQNRFADEARDEGKQKEARPFDESLTRANVAGIAAIGSSIDVIPQMAGVVKDKVAGSIKDVGNAMGEIRTMRADQATKAAIANDQAKTAQAVRNGAVRNVAPGAMADTQRAQIALPKPQEVLRHQVEVAPVKLDINITKDDGFNVDTTTDRPKDTTITTVNRAAAQGGLNSNLRN